VKVFYKPGAILFALLALAGCASTGVIRQVSPISNSVPISVDFALVKTSTALAGLEPEVQMLNDLVISGLRGRQIFGDVDGDPAAAGSSGGIKIEIKILDIKKISRDERQWAGALAGRARILVRASITDLSSGKPVETFDAEGQSSGGSNLAGITDEAVQRAAEQVVAEVIRISRHTGP
jgi:hypothetical protein